MPRNTAVSVAEQLAAEKGQHFDSLSSSDQHDYIKKAEKQMKTTVPISPGIYPPSAKERRS